MSIPFLKKVKIIFQHRIVLRAEHVRVYIIMVEICVFFAIFSAIFR